MRFGIIGAGRHGARYLKHLQQGDVSGAAASVVWRQDARAAKVTAAAHGARAVPDWRHVVEAADVDAVIVATPPGAHAEAIIAAVAAGKPVLTEKPVCATLAEALALKAALPADAPVMVAQTLRFNAALVAAREALPRIGTVQRLRIAQRLPPNDIAWQRDPALAGGGSVTLTGVHGFDLLRWLTGGTPDAVHCRCEAIPPHPFECLFDARFSFDDRPLLASCEVAKFSTSRSALLELVGTDGQLWVDYQQGRVLHLAGRGVETLAEPGDRPTLPAALEAFCRWRRGETPCPVPLAEGIETLRMADACYRSDAAGVTVRIGVNPPATHATA